MTSPSPTRTAAAGDIWDDDIEPTCCDDDTCGSMMSPLDNSDDRPRAPR